LIQQSTRLGAGLTVTSNTLVRKREVGDC